MILVKWGRGCASCNRTEIELNKAGSDYETVIIGPHCGEDKRCISVKKALGKLGFNSRFPVMLNDEMTEFYTGQEFTDIVGKLKCQKKKNIPKPQVLRTSEKPEEKKRSKSSISSEEIVKSSSEKPNLQD